VPESDNIIALATPGSASWRVRAAFATNSTGTGTDADTSSVKKSPSPIPQPALHVETRFRTLFNHPWLDSRCATVLLWSLPVLTAFLYALSSRASNDMATNEAVQNTLFYTIAFLVAAFLSLALAFARVETSFLVKELLCTFESTYLIVWMMFYLMSSFAQIPNEMAARSVELGVGVNEFIFFFFSSAMGILSCFLIVLCSDALIRLSVWFKIYVRILQIYALAARKRRFF
jgi:hypothetical protein